VAYLFLVRRHHCNLVFVRPPGPRHTATEDRDGLVVRIPSKRNIFILAFLTFWLCGWLGGEIMVPFTFFTGAKKEPAALAFMVFWLCGWTVGGGFALYIWLWHIKGCELITISPIALSIKREVFGFGRSRHFEASEIRHLRVAPFTYNPYDFRSSLAFWGIGGGALAFDYGFKTFRFGAGVDEAEARVILQTITKRLPHLIQENAA
jgi:hypothetical protein